MHVRTILAPTEPAVRYALQAALEQGAAVIVYHVITQDSDWFGKNEARSRGS